MAVHGDFLPHSVSTWTSSACKDVTGGMPDLGRRQQAPWEPHTESQSRGLFQPCMKQRQMTERKVVTWTIGSGWG